MMPLSLFVLALYVLLRSIVDLGWFAIDARFIAFVGIAFVVVVVLEATVWRTVSWPWSRKA